jgi:2-desacetyl-2-hydroxyethyl bacteriochlorophyllide A dehydrogenase
MMSTRSTVYFDAPYQVTIHEEPLPIPGGDTLLVQTQISAISAGTEMLFYRGMVPPGMAVDTTLTSLTGAVAYPIAYGYAAVGKVIACGPQTSDDSIGQMVFAFQPHTTHFLARRDDLMPLPPSVAAEAACFLPNLETAVNLLMDARPLIGERVLVLGQGVVGLLVTALLAQYPLGQLVVVDDYAQRLSVARALGATQTLRPGELPTLSGLDPDLILELSGSPDALASAVDLARFGTRIVVGSWYGQKPVTLPLGAAFHRNRVQIVSSQVSTIDGQYHNRWSKARRFSTVWEQLKRVPVRDLISHRLPLHHAPAAYRLLDHQPDQTIQVLFTY